MTKSVWILVLLAALGHALWNVIAKKTDGNPVIMWWSFMLGSVSMIPLSILMIFIGNTPNLTLGSCLCLIATGVLHAIYFALLSKAYSVGDISIVYPVSRGTGVGLTGLGGFFLFKETISIIDASGIGLILIGIVVISIPAIKSKKSDKRSIFLAIGVGTSIVCYSLVDKLGVGQLHPIHYITGMWILGTLFRWPWIFDQYRGNLFQIALSNWQTISLIGLGSLITYLLILYAYTKGQVSHIVAARESSIVIAAAIGILFLNEKINRFKIAGIFSITSGLIMLGIG